MAENLTFEDGKVYGPASEIKVWLVSEIGKLATSAGNIEAVDGSLSDLEDYFTLVAFIDDNYENGKIISVSENMFGGFDVAPYHEESDT